MNDIPKTHSKIGIASFFLGLLSIGSFVCIFLSIGISAGLQTNFTDYALPIFFLLMCALALAAFVLGTASFFQKKTKRIFGVLGFALGLSEMISIGLSIFLFTKFLEALGKALGSGFGKM